MSNWQAIQLYITITSMREHLIIEHTQTSFTPLKKLKIQFPIKPRHIRKTCDHGTRGFAGVNPILSGLFLFRPYFESYFEKRGQKWITQK